MAEEEKKVPKFYPERWSAIAPGDLGLQVAYWTGKDEDPVTFRPILGWITCTLDEVPDPADKIARNGFAPIVLADFWLPVPASNLPNYEAVVPKGLNSADVLPRLKAWREKPEAAQDKVNVPGIAKA